MDPATEAEIDRILLYLTSAETGGDPRLPRGLMAYDGIEPVTDHFVSRIGTGTFSWLNEADVAIRHPALERFPGGEVPLSALQGDIHFSWLSHTLHERGILALYRVREVRPHEVRGRVARVYPRMARFTMTTLGNLGSVERVTDAYCGLEGSQWIVAEGALRGLNPELRDVARRVPSRMVDTAVTMQVMRQHDWRVLLGYEGFPRISFVTDPLGAREVFRLRDIPEGRQRRAALRHWVSEHWRHVNRGENPTRVREHLRGATSFSWNGLRCEVRPSLVDLERNHEEPPVDPPYVG